MTLRAVILGTLLALFIATTAYFNDWVINQTHLIGNHLPIGVFGVVMLLMMLLNPLLRLWRQGAGLRSSELAVIAALGLVVCAWPGSNFFRTYVAAMAMPGHEYRSEGAWRAAEVLSYLPGGSPRIARGHVRDWPALARAVEAGQDGQTRPGALLWEYLDGDDRDLIGTLAAQPFIEGEDRRALLEVLNDRLIEPADPDASPPPLFTRISQEHLPPAARRALAQRQAALERIEVLEQRRQGKDEQRQRMRSTVADELERLTRRSRELGEQAAALATEPQTDQVLAQLAALRERQRQKQQRISGIEAELFPVERAHSRLGWQVGYHQQRADLLTRRANRAVLVDLLDGLVMAAPRGRGVLLNDGQVDDFATETLVRGWDGDRALRFSDLPWWVWRDTIITWGGIALLLTIAVLLLAVIVHPQWSQRELLPYPLVRFVEEATTTQPGRILPDIMRNRTFWIAFGIVMGIHGINAIHAWFPQFIQIPLMLDFTPARRLFPEAGQVPHGNLLFTPTIYVSVVGFAYFLNKEVSLSVGLSLLLWAVFGGILLAQGVPVGNEFFGTTMSQMIRFGAYFGMALTILYMGRSYYANVVASVFGFKRGIMTPAYATWAARGMIVALAGAGVLLNRFAGLDPLLAGLFILCFVVMSLGMARLMAETGVFFVQPFFMPVGVLMAFFGASALGPEAIIALALASAVMLNDPRESAMPFFVNALHLSDKLGKTPPRKILSPMLAILVVGFFIALAMTLYWQYNEGVAPNDGWAPHVARYPMRILTSQTSQLEARGELAESNELSGLARLTAAAPITTSLGWAAFGMAMVLLFAAARMRLAWWPLHPVLFLLVGSYPAAMMSFSFLLGWLVKSVTMRLAGVKGYRLVMPFMVGMIAAELLAALAMLGVGALYYGVTGSTPQTYRILPG